MKKETSNCQQPSFSTFDNPHIIEDKNNVEFALSYREFISVYKQLILLAEELYEMQPQKEEGSIE